MKRVGYGRVSTAGQARNGTSLAEQKKQLMAAGVAAVSYTHLFISILSASELSEARIALPFFQ